MDHYLTLKRLFAQAGHRLYIVGGFVRDRLLGVAPGGDMDLCTDAVPDQVREILEKAGFAVLEMGLDYGTLTGLDRDTGRTFEITTLRTGERYFPGSRHPKVTFGTDLADDLARRDFTVNAMVLDEEGRLVDPFGGARDLENRVLRTPGDPRVSFREDPLRILRAYRFMATLGFTLEEGAARAAGQHRDELSHVAGERKLKEMNLLLSAPADGLPRTLNAMLESGVLTGVLPGLSGLAKLRGRPSGRHHFLDAWDHTLEVVRNTPPDPLLRWAALFHDSGKPGTLVFDDEGEPHYRNHEALGAGLALEAALAMRFTRAWKKTLVYLVKNHMRPVLYHSGWGEGAVRRLAASAGENLERLLALARADTLSKEPETARRGLEKLEELEERLRGLSPRGRLLRRGTGKALQEKLGFRGERLGEAISRLEEAVISGELPTEPDPESCVRFLGPPSDEGRRPGP